MKDKLGTRKVPTAELALDGAQAQLVAGTGDGGAPVDRVCMEHGLAAGDAHVGRLELAVGPGDDHDLVLAVLRHRQQRRAALARLVVSQARLWVLDEPWVALDADSVALLSHQLDAHVRRGGALMFTSHQAAPLATSGQTVSLHA